MIAKVPVTPQGGGSFSRLCAYISRADDFIGEREPVMADDQLATEQTIAGDGKQPALLTNCLSVETAPAEMVAAAAVNRRVRNPAYHVILSWRAGEEPDDARMFEAGRMALGALGMDEHQFVMAAHRDTECHHLHVAVNRVHPETGKAVSVQRDFYTLDRTMREIELVQGWSHDHGPYGVVERDGRMMVERVDADIQTKGKQPSPSRDMEVRGHESLFSYARGEPHKAVLAVLKQPTAQWQDLHRALGRHGLELREKGQGFAIHAKAGEITPIKASDVHEDLSKGRLTKRLGPYQPPIRAIAVDTPDVAYDKQREPSRQRQPRDPALREARAVARQDLRQRYETVRAAELADRAKVRLEAGARLRQRLTAVTTTHKADRQRIRDSGASPLLRKALYSVAAMEAAQAREAARATRPERAGVRSYRDWVADRAEEGDQAAIAQLRGWRSAEQRNYQPVPDRIMAASAWAMDPLAPAQAPLDVRRLAHEIDRRTGDVRYSLNRAHVFTDHGQAVAFSTAGTGDAHALASGILLAREKFGRTLALTGSEAFKGQAIRIMAERGMDVTLDDPALEQQRQAAVAVIREQRLAAARPQPMPERVIPERDRDLSRPDREMGR